MSTSEPPPWPHCAHGADPAADPVGCRGIVVPGHTTCLAHLADADRDAYLAGLTPGTGIDHRGTPFTERLLNALRDPATGKPSFGFACFESATFLGDVEFPTATFHGDTGFESATFQGGANFTSATFKNDAWFESATFQDVAGFGAATFQRIAGFGAATFQGEAWFDSVTFESDALFESAGFERRVNLGPLVCAGRVRLSGAEFN